MSTPTLVYTNGTTTGAASFLSIVDTLLTNAFNSTVPKGLGWEAFYVDGYDKLYFTLGSGASERAWLRLTASMDDGYIERQICQVARANDGYMLNAIGGTTDVRINVDAVNPFDFWIIGNQDFFHLVTLVGSTYSHYYCGIINRFAPNQNSSIYGQNPPMPANTIVADIPFTVATGTVLYLRTGFDAYGGYGANNVSFIPGQKLMIIDQSLDTGTTGNIGVVVLNSVDLINDAINVTYVSGSDSFSSFAIVGIDPQPITLNTGGTIRNNPFIMLDDTSDTLAPQLIAVNEFAVGNGVPEGLENPNARGVYITYPIRLFNDVEARGTLYGIIDTPLGSPGPQDLFQTFDGLFVFMNFPDGNLRLAIGSII